MDILLEEVSKKLFQYCLKGHLNLIIQLMKPYPFRQRSAIVNKPQQIETFNLKQITKSETTCLLVACLKNNFEIVKYLVEQCGASIDQLSSSKDFEDWDCLTFFVNKSKKYNEALMPNFNYTASVLWHACRSSDFKIIRFLIQAHANVNSNEETTLHSTPLMVTCCKSRFEEIKFLLKDGKANINQKDINGENCLFYAVRCNQNCINILEFLISKEADVNCRNKDGKTVLELAADLDLHHVMEFLVQNGARIFSGLNGVSMLSKTAITGHISMYSLLFESSDILPIEKINSLEIVGLTSAYGSIKSCKLPSFQNIPYSIMYWECSIDLRNNLKNLRPKKIRKLEGFLDEFKTYADLKSIQNDIIEFQMQSLWIIDRMLTENPLIDDYYALADFNFYDFLEMSNKQIDYDHTALHRSAYLANYMKNFNRLCKLWIFGLAIQIEHLDSMHTSILRNIIGLICLFKMAQKENKFKSSTNKFTEENIVLGETLIKLLKICIFELSNANVIALNNNGDISFEDISENKIKQFRQPTKLIKTDTYSANTDILLRITVSLFRFIAQLQQDSMLSQNHLSKMKSLISVIVGKKFNYQNANSTLIGLLVKNNLLCRLSIDSEFNYEDFVTINAIKLVLDCGADPNQAASTRCPKKSALNSAVFSKDLKNKKQSDELILLLLQYGAHLDFTTSAGQTVVEKYKLKFAGSILNLINPVKFTSLQCLAAKTINNHRLVYKNVLSKNLTHFVERH